MPLISGETKDILAQCGRNFGKTNLVSYLLWRWAIENPGSENYYFAPYGKQAREILWAPNIIQGFGPKDALAEDPNKTAMRLTLKNGSFIKLDGSDNVDAYRGVKPRGLTVYDEFKDFRPEFHEAYDPNRAAFDSPLVIIGTPPNRDCQFVQLAENYRSTPTKRFFKMPTSTNPHISPKWLDEKKAELIAKGEEDVWQREYMAEYTPGGKAKIFPMLTDSMVVPHDPLIQRLKRDRKKLQWILWSDPASSSCFAVLFIAYNPYNKCIYCLDEIYEQSQGAMSSLSIGSEIVSKRNEINSWIEEWRMGYDEAATWWHNEWVQNFPSENGLEPSHKSANSKDSGLSIIKDILVAEKLVISDRCKKLFWEMDNYFKDKNGKIPKEHDHLIDCLRYIISALGYITLTKEEYIEKLDEDFRGEALKLKQEDEWNFY